MSVSKLAKARGKILDEMMAYHREELPKIKREIPEADVRALASVAPPPRDFVAALRQPGVSLIAECKKASPSKGLIAPKYNAVELAKTYEKGGAAAVSVLTDGRHFQGSLADLRDVAEAVRLPVLRKDFIFDPYQIYEARAAGASAVLLIVRVLGDGDLAELLQLTRKLGMEALVEVHDAEELARALAVKPAVIGVNNRNLQTFAVDFENTARLRTAVPEDVVLVGESGIKNADDIAVMRRIGVDAVLVGETLVRSKNRLALVRELVAAGKRGG
jgi:indole-3-glycerol phosphate synthase